MQFPYPPSNDRVGNAQVVGAFFGIIVALALMCVTTLLANSPWGFMSIFGWLPLCCGLGAFALGELERRDIAKEVAERQGGAQ